MAMNQEQWISVRKIGSTGWNVFDDQQDVDDTDITDVLNMVYDKSYPTPRGGSRLAYAKPAGETESLLCLFSAKSSTGVNHIIAVYAPNFYFRDKVNDQWVKINDNYTPSQTYKTLMYGYANWNAGIPNDFLYACNGTESFVKWQMSVGYVTANTLAGSSTLTLDDAVTFPAGSTSIVVKEAGGSEIYLTSSSRTGNVLTLSAPLAVDIDAGAVVVAELNEVAAMQKGKIISKFSGRLMVANQAGGETTLFGSEVGDPESFSPGSAASDPFSEVITDGNGGITGLDDFGEYLLIEKADSQFKLAIATALDTDGNSFKEVNILPIVTGISMGPINPWAKIKKNNMLYYVTETEGIFSTSPTITGTQTSIAADILSLKIQPFARSLDYSESRTTTFDQKLLWSATSASTSDTILVYDLLRGTWTRFNNWAVKDWLIDDKKLYYGSRIDDAIYECFTDTKLDGETPFESYFKTKAYDMGQPSLAKTMGYIFLSGFLSAQEDLYFDVLFNLNGRLQTITYKLDGDGNLIFAYLPQALAMAVLGIFTAGSVEYEENENGIGYFTIYIAIPFKYGFYTISIKPRSTVNGTNWGVTGIGFSPILNLKHDGNLQLGPIGDVSNDS